VWRLEAQELSCLQHVIIINTHIQINSNVHGSVQQPDKSIFIKNEFFVEYYSWKKYLYFGRTTVLEDKVGQLYFISIPLSDAHRSYTIDGATLIICRVQHNPALISYLLIL